MMRRRSSHFVLELANLLSSCVDSRNDDLPHFCALVFDVLSARTLAMLRPSRADVRSRSASSETKKGTSDT